MPYWCAFDPQRLLNHGPTSMYVASNSEGSNPRRCNSQRKAPTRTYRARFFSQHDTEFRVLGY